MGFFGIGKKKKEPEEAAAAATSQSSPAPKPASKPAPKKPAPKPATSGKEKPAAAKTKAATSKKATTTKAAAAPTATKSKASKAASPNNSVKVDEFYVALVLDLDAKESKALKDKEVPNLDHLESLRRATGDYLLKKMSSKSLYPTLQRVEVTFQHLQYGTQKPAPKFQVYWEANATFHFPLEVPKDASPARLFDTMGREFDHDKWIKDVLFQQHPKQVSGGGKGSHFSKALQVQVRRLAPATEGGAVMAPPFYLGFGCTPAPKKNLSKKEHQQIAKYAHDQFIPHLKREWPGGFKSLDIQVKKSEINEKASKPDDRYNLYIQFEAIGKFSKRSPEPTEFFRVMSIIMEKDYARNFHDGLDELGGTLATTMRQAIRVCAWYDPDGDGGGEVDSDEGEGGENGDEGDLDNANQEDDPLTTEKVHLEFNVALVVRDLEDLPNEKQLKEFNAFMKAYFTKRLKKEYKEEFIKFDSFDAPEPKYNVGRPLPRFNMIHQYVVVLVLHKPAPPPMDILKKIVASKVLALHNTIKLLSEPWNHTKEVTLGKGDYRKAPKDQVYGGVLDKAGNLVLPKEDPSSSSTKKTPPQEKEEDPDKKLKLTAQQLPPNESEKEGINLKPIPPKPVEIDEEPSDPVRNLDEPAVSEKVEDDDDAPVPPETGEESPVEESEETEPKVEDDETPAEEEGNLSQEATPDKEESSEPPTEEETIKDLPSKEGLTEEEEEDPIQRLKVAPKELPTDEQENETVELKPIPPKTVDTDTTEYPSRNLDEPSPSNEVDDEEPAPEPELPEEELPTEEPQETEPEGEEPTPPVKEEEAEPPAEDSTKKLRPSGELEDEEDPNRKLKLTAAQLPPPEEQEKEKVILKPIPPKIVTSDTPSYLSHNIEERTVSKPVDDDELTPPPEEEASTPPPLVVEEPSKESILHNDKPTEGTSEKSEEDSKKKYQRQPKPVEEEKEARKFKIKPGQGKSPPPKEPEKAFNPDEIEQWDKPEEQLTPLQLHLLKFKKKKQQPKQDDAAP